MQNNIEQSTEKKQKKQGMAQTLDFQPKALIMTLKQHLCELIVQPIDRFNGPKIISIARRLSWWRTTSQAPFGSRLRFCVSICTYERVREKMYVYFENIVNEVNKCWGPRRWQMKGKAILHGRNESGMKKTKGKRKAKSKT